MPKKNRNPPEPDANTLAFYNDARTFADAARALISVANLAGAETSLSSSRPILFLYHHAIELLLKAVLRSHGKSINGTNLQVHNLEFLYEEVKALGLKVSDRSYRVHNTISLLTQANVDHGLRYYNMKSTGAPGFELASKGFELLHAAITSDFARRKIEPEKEARLGKVIMTLED